MVILRYPFVNLYVHSLSATKWIGGHRTTIGGVVIDEGKFPWNNGRFLIFTNKNPDYYGLIYWETFGYNAFTIKTRSKITRNIGPCQNPFYQYKVHRQVENALELARWLESRDDILWFHIQDLNHILIMKMPKNIYGMDLTFGVKGDANVGATLIDTLQLVSYLAYVGDEKTLVMHPA
ncbi:hypothetical protein RhiirA4_470720 [Rhizophagus irregularis]|uniref:Uncharacterized protein n=1 Tax=Rhizophagus irregularis TaxID=588596 RepID=A0A2I1H1Z6_9GLOM|nr:hypothetical protein RhiirA4_470720 [Rhizophagus irregularis]